MTTITMITNTTTRWLSFFGSTAPSDPSIPLNEIVIRQWELNENSTHYDALVAAPSDRDLITFWSGWAGIMLTTAVLCTAIWIPLTFSKRIKKNPFNLYLIFLLTPDMIVAWICGITCLRNALAGKFTSTFACQFQSFYMIASISANAWLNCAVAHELYKMLSCSQHFKRYKAPTHKQVALQSCGIYAYSIFLGLLGNLGFEWWPHKTRLTIGAACIPMDYSGASTAFFYGVFFPLLFGLPLGYVCYAGYQIWKQQMLPPSGRRRILAIYFFRLAAVFLIMWLPGLLLLFVIGAWMDPWVEWAGGSWSHLQGAVSALVSLMKPDIWKAVSDFWFCRSDKGNIQTDESRSSQFMTTLSARGSILVNNFKSRRSLSTSKFGTSSVVNSRKSSKDRSRHPKPLISMEELKREQILQTQISGIMSSIQERTSGVASMMEEESESNQWLDNAAPITWNMVPVGDVPQEENNDNDSVITDVCPDEKPSDFNDSSHLDPEENLVNEENDNSDDDSVINYSIADICPDEKPSDGNHSDPDLEEKPVN